ALTSTFPDTRRLTLIRLFQRRMLDQGHVQAAVRWREEDADADVRRTAFQLTLYARPHLVQALRERDKELNRQLVELETFGQERRGPPPRPPPRSARRRPVRRWKGRITTRCCRRSPAGPSIPACVAPAAWPCWVIRVPSACCCN